MTIPTDLLIGAYTPLTPSRHLNIPREKHLTEFFYHRRKGSLPSDIRSSLRNIQSSQNNNLIHLKYGKILKKGSHKNSNTDKNLTSVSINMKQIKVPGTKDLHGSKHSTKSAIHHPKLGNTTMIKPGKLIKAARHGSIGNQLGNKPQRKSFVGVTSVRHKKNSISFFKSKRTSEEFSQMMYQGLEKLKNREMEQAIECFDKVIELFSNIPEASFNRGIAYFESDMVAKALVDFEKVADRWPKHNKSTYLYLSVIYVKVSDPESAITSVIVLIIHS